MVKVSVEVHNGASRFDGAVRAESVWQAVSLAGRRYPGGDVRVRFPIDHEGFFVKDATVPAGTTA